MLNVFNVAYYILDECGEMSTFKLHKLLYYCQVWYMAWNDGNPLFQEDFEAWVNGPVVREVFNLHKGAYDVNVSDFKEYFISLREEDRCKSCIDKVLLYYKNKDSVDLVLMTHREKPWKDVRNTLSPSDLSIKIISKNSIYEYYKDKSIEILSLVEL